MTSNRLERAIDDGIDELRKRKFIDATKLSLDEWLTLVKSHDREELVFVDYRARYQ